LGIHDGPSKQPGDLGEQTPQPMSDDAQSPQRTAKWL
jgi:hypothetical protein